MYDGSKFHGWQIQNNAHTVQSEIEKKLAIITKEQITVVGAGRTDAGVHATDQYAHFDSTLTIPNHNLQKALNSMLMPNIYVKRAGIAAPGFHARYKAYERTYHYLITKNPLPFWQSYSLYHTQRFSIDSLNTYAKLFLGKHDFFAFSRYNPAIPDTVCEVLKSHFIQYNHGLVYSISADRFLHNMVRRIIGTILMLAADKADPLAILAMLANHTPKQKYIVTFPPHGLYLVKVKYPVSFELFSNHAKQ
jgi:tRNA pseudouridine38-40 synthase